MTRTLELPVANVPPPGYIVVSDTSGPKGTDILLAFFRWSRSRVATVDTTAGCHLYADNWATAMADSTSVTVPSVDASLDLEGEAMSVSERLKLVSKTLSLTKSELARVLGVSRQTIYEWLRGKDISPENDRRLLRLGRLAWEFAGSSHPGVLRRLIVEPRKEGLPSILEMLVSKTWDETALRAALTEARDRTSKRGDNRAEIWLQGLGFPEPGPNAKAANVDFNLMVDDTNRP